MLDTSNIQIVYIMPEHYGMFENFDPLDKLELAALPGAFSIGAFDVGADETDKIPVGLMVVTQSRGSLTCEWLAVAENYRGRDIGGTMLRMLFEVAEKKGCKTVRAVFSAQSNVSAQRYFSQRFFEKREDFGEYLISASKFVNEGVFSSATVSGHCFSLLEAGSRIANEAAAFAKKTGSLHALSDGEIWWNIADPELTTIYTDGEKVRGVLVVRENDDVYTPVLLAASSEEVVDALIAESVKRLKGRSFAGKEICVFVRDEYIKELMEDIMGSAESDRVVILTAGVRDYAAYRDSLENEETNGAITGADGYDSILADGLLDLEYYLRF